MNINRDNYEEFFVLYIDKELTPAENAAVENFIDRNPDLKPELEMLQQTILPLDEMETFGNKNLLFRNEGEPVAAVINELNCEAFFVLYADNELNNNENALVEEFIYRHPQYQENFELIQQVKFQPEKHIVYPDKSTLYRSENDHKVVPMFTRMRSWKMVAAAAVLLMIGGTVWYALSTNGGTANDENSLATNNPAVRQPAATDQIKSGKTITDKRNTDQATTDQPKSNEVNNPATLQSPSADDTNSGTDISPVKVQKASDYNSTELAASQHKAASTSARLL
ncbi:MAG: hypothetical protein EOO04_31640 [Chitinophagaceae bacterium]|nr:MAG: hypothetical protein EOO04_31640 [Chitinophagaceae bacterium]